MRRVATLLVLAGCNQALGLQETAERTPIDAQFFDAPTDAPFSCPPMGTLPEFSRVFHQIVQDCHDATTGAAWAVARCVDPQPFIGQGSTEGLFAPIPSVNLLAPLQARLAPEGDTLYVHSQLAGASKITIFGRGPTDAWTVRGEMTTTDPELAVFSSLGSPTRGPRPHMMVNLGNGAVRELELDPSGAATVVGSYDTTALPGIYELAPNLGADGLRLVYGNRPDDTAMYSDRASVTERFSPARPLPGLPPAGDLFLTEDCARLYFSGTVASLLWVDRR